MHIKPSNNKNCCIFDFDSTLINIESLDLLISMSNNTNTNIQVDLITKAGMNGEISFQESILQRLHISTITIDDICKTIEETKQHITHGAIDLINKLSSIADIYIISGGFLEIIHPIAHILQIKPNNCFGNSFIFHNNKVIGMNNDNPLSRDQGKITIARDIITTNNYENIFMIGDGYTDLQVSQYIPEIIFCCFCQNIAREKVISLATNHFYDTDALYDYLAQIMT